MPLPCALRCARALPGAFGLVAIALLAGCTEATTELPRWTLTETLRLGGAEEGPTSFDYAKGIAVDASGRLFIYDRTTQDIRVFAADGAHIRTIGRRGSGPGELRDAEGIAFAPDGKLWVRDAANGRFSIFSAEGAFERSWPMGFCSSQGLWAPSVDPDGRLIDAECAVIDGRAQGEVILGYHTDLSRVDTISVKPTCGTRELAESRVWITRTATMTRYQGIPFAAGAVNALGGGGELWCAPDASRYEILRLAAGATDTLRIVRDLAPVAVTAAERDSVIAEIEAKGPTGLDFSRIPATKASIDRMTTDDRGRLWVRRATAAGEIAFDVYDANGAPLAEAVLGRYQSALWHPFLIQGENLYAVVTGEDDLQYIARFRISR